MGTLKKIGLQGFRAIGAFNLAPYLTSGKLRILCYHGISYDKEHLFSAGTFMRSETFRQRLEYLRDWGAVVLPLDVALDKLVAGELPRKSVTITIDDGWYGSYEHMLPLLKDYDYPATLYSSTYYTQKQTFVFNMLVPYIFFCTTEGVLDLSGIDTRLSGNYSLANTQEKRAAVDRIIQFGESELDATDRDALCYKVADACNFNIQRVANQRMFKFMNSDELARLPAMGFDVQLHTHRHVFSCNDKAAAVRELMENQEVLSNLGISACKHFCYPSGEYVNEHANWLESMSIRSSVTTDFGLPTKRTSPFYLPRICDSESMSLLDFHAAVSGFKTLFGR